MTAISYNNISHSLLFMWTRSSVVILIYIYTHIVMPICFNIALCSASKTNDKMTQDVNLWIIIYKMVCCALCNKSCGTNWICLRMCAWFDICYVWLLLFSLVFLFFFVIVGDSKCVGQREIDECICTRFQNEFIIIWKQRTPKSCQLIEIVALKNNDIAMLRVRSVCVRVCVPEAVRQALHARKADVTTTQLRQLHIHYFNLKKNSHKSQKPIDLSTCQKWIYRNEIILIPEILYMLGLNWDKLKVWIGLQFYNSSILISFWNATKI